MYILGETKVTAINAKNWAIKNGAVLEFADLTRLYWKHASEKGVRPEIAFAQAIHETNWGKFTGQVKVSSNNFCGLKTKNGTAFAEFPTKEMGIIAQLDHLALYAGSPGYPYIDTPDSRHFHILFGTAKTVELLAGKWGEDSVYGKKIVSIVKDLTGE